MCVLNLEKVKTLDLLAAGITGSCYSWERTFLNHLAHDFNAINILKFIYITLNSGNGNKLIKKEVLFMKTIC